MPEKPIALSIAAASLAAMIAQVLVCLEQYAPVTVLESVWFLLGFFTILTHICVVVMFSAIALGKPIPRLMRGTIALASACVGIIFHLLLADQFNFEGLAWWADLALHTLIPLAVLGWWLAYTRREQVRWSDPFLWVLYPIAYGISALIRGPLNISEHYPYGFLDPTKLGYDGVALVFLGMAAAFIGFGLGMIACVKRPWRSDPGGAQP
ncbi:MAG: Pr6Pr family membrane protein [Planctomycetota bacterium]|nr:Pr6Pr family membrane protein [Planctomycetota bacterium]